MERPLSRVFNPQARTIAPPTKVLHDAMFQAAEDLVARDIDRRRIVIVVSDGRNQNSLHSYDTALERLLMHGVQVFAFGVDTSVFQRVRSSLVSYAKATGGDAVFRNPRATSNPAILLSTEEARNQYVLGYVSTNKRPADQAGIPGNQGPGRADRDVEIRHKKGYYQTPVKTLKIQKFKLTAPMFNTILVPIGMTDLNM